MSLIEELKLMNFTKIKCLKECGKNCRRNELIVDLLKDEACFFKMEKNEAYMILQDIGVVDQKLEETYLKLISTDEFYRLVQCKKIQEDDEEVKIKYKMYSSDVFKK